MINRVKDFIDCYNGEVDRYRRAGTKEDVDAFVRYERIKWSRDLKHDLQRGTYAEYAESKIRESLFRPFTRKYLFYDRVLNEEVRSFAIILPTDRATDEN